MWLHIQILDHLNCTIIKCNEYSPVRKLNYIIDETMIEIITSHIVSKTITFKSAQSIPCINPDKTIRILEKPPDPIHHQSILQSMCSDDRLLRRTCYRNNTCTKE